MSQLFNIYDKIIDIALLRGRMIKYRFVWLILSVFMLSANASDSCVITKNNLHQSTHAKLTSADGAFVYMFHFYPEEISLVKLDTKSNAKQMIEYTNIENITIADNGSVAINLVNKTKISSKFDKSCTKKLKVLADSSSYRSIFSY